MNVEGSYLFATPYPQRGHPTPAPSNLNLESSNYGKQYVGLFRRFKDNLLKSAVLGGRFSR
jgi:hypothetical protein